MLTCLSAYYWFFAHLDSNMTDSESEEYSNENANKSSVRFFYATSIFFPSITIRLCHLRACTDTWMKRTENTMNLLTAPIDALHKNLLLFCICGIEAETQYRSFVFWKYCHLKEFVNC